MPCVNLANTFAHWQGRRLPTCAEIRQLEQPQQEVPLIKAAQTRPAKDKTLLKVPHPRKAFSGATARATLPNVNLSRPVVRMTRADLINAESKLGSTIFGPIPEGHRREFFHDKQNVWIWHEDWYDGQHNPHQMTVRYEVRTSGIYKKVSAGKYFRLEGDELENFRKATRAYLYVIKQKLYNNNLKSPKTA